MVIFTNWQASYCAHVLKMPMKYELEDEGKSKVAVVLFTDVTNSKEIKQKLIEGTLQATFLNPKLIIDIFQILIAANKAVHNEIQKKMKTRSIQSEILYSLSPSKNITQSLKNFGINDSDTEVLVVILNDENDKNLNEITKAVQGTQADISILQKFTDEKLIRKIYSINDEEFNTRSIVDSVVTRIAVKDYT